MYVATDRETSDNTEATRFSQCAHDQRRRLEAEDCNSIRCAQLISGGRRRIRPCPPHCLAHARPTMCCIRLVIIIRRSLVLVYDPNLRAGTRTNELFMMTCTAVRIPLATADERSGVVSGPSRVMEEGSHGAGGGREESPSGAPAHSEGGRPEQDSARLADVSEGGGRR